MSPVGSRSAIAATTAIGRPNRETPMADSRDRFAALPPIRRRNPPVSLRRIGAMVLRYWYLLRGSWPRMLELAYWPTVQMVMWGFISTFLMTTSGFFAQAFGVLLAAVLLWDILFRSQLGVSISFFEEMWSRNLGHLMVSPLRPGEFMAALVTMSVIRTIIGVFPATLLAIWFFGFSIYAMGLAFVAFFVNLMITGWAVGLFVAGLVLRNGLGAETLAWALIFAMAPLSAVYYPIDVLPGWVQVLSYALPPSYVFEGMRAVLIDQEFRADLMLAAVALNMVYLALGAWSFLRFFHTARLRGRLLQIGE